jgi:hypothetical protein
MARRLARSAYARVSASSLLRRPLAAVRGHPRVRAFARRHLDALLGPGATWANVDGALRLLAEDPDVQIVFGPWQGDLAGELLYWAPFVRWAQDHFSIDPARIAAVSKGAAHVYGDVCSVRSETVDGARRAFPEAVLFRPEPVLALVEAYRSGAAAPRPLLKRARHVRLAPAAETDTSGADRYVAVALAATEAFPDSDANRRAVEELSRSLARAGGVVSLDGAGALPAQHAVVARASGLVAASSGIAILGALSGVPVVATRSADGAVVEPDVDLAIRVAASLGGSLMLLDIGDLASLAEALTPA